MEKKAKNLYDDEFTLEDIILREDAEVSRAAIEAMKSVATPWQRLKGEAIVSQGEICDRWIFVAKGLCRILFSKNGKTTTLLFDGGGAIFTSFHSMITGERSVFGMEALLPCHGWEITQDQYRDLVRRFPELLRFEVSFLHKSLYCIESHYAQFALSTPEERYRDFFMRRDFMSETRISGQGLMKRISLKIIAQYLSMTQQTLSVMRRRDALKRLKEKKGQ